MAASMTEFTGQVEMFGCPACGAVVMGDVEGSMQLTRGESAHRQITLNAAIKVLKLRVVHDCPGFPPPF